jgi:predicted transcriptional regulator
LSLISPHEPYVILQVLSITEDQLKEAQEKQVAPTASLNQFEEAMKAAVDEDDDINNYSVVLKKHINRMQVAEAVITTLRYAHGLQAFISP